MKTTRAAWLPWPAARSDRREAGVMPSPHVPQGGGRGGGRRGDVSKTADGPTVAPDAPTPAVTPEQPKAPPPDPPRPTGTPPSDPTPLLQPPVDPPSFLYWVIAGLVLLALMLAWYTYKLRLRMAASSLASPGPAQSSPASPGPAQSGPSDSGPSLFASPSAAQAGAEKGLKDHGLDKREDWRKYLWSGNELVKPLEPVLVQQIDTTHLDEAFYYLVPFGLNLASVKAVACVDGVTGEYLECTRFEADSAGSWGRMIGPWRTAASTRATVREGKIDLHLGARALVGKPEIGVHPQLVWKPCKQSQSIFLPFRLVKVGDNVRYIRIDGVVFDKLS